MIEVKDDNQNILAFKVSGKLTKSELDDLVPTLEKHVKKYEDPHLLMIMENFKGWDGAEAFWKDLQLDAKYIGHFDRIAVAGDKKWQDWGTKLVNPITKEELKFFPIDQTDEAWDWIEQNHN